MQVYRNIIAMAVFLMATLTTQAQEVKTDVSLVKQYKNNAVPGLRYAPASVKPSAGKKNFTGSSLKLEIENGKQVTRSAGGAAPAITIPQQHLSSEQSAKEDAKLSKRAVMPPLPPMQDSTAAKPTIEK